MAIAFVTVKVKVGHVKSILDKLRNVDNVVEAHAVTGPYDIIIKIEGEKLENIAKMVVTKIQNEIAGVQDTITYLVIDL